MAKYKKALWTAIKIILGLALLLFVLSKVNVADITLLIEHISYQWLIATFLFFCLMFLLKALQYRYLIGKQITYKQALQNILLQNAISNFVASGAGIVSSVALFKSEQGVKLKRSIGSLFIAKISDLIVIWVSFLYLSYLLWDYILPLSVLILSMLISIGIGLFLFFLALCFHRGFIWVVNLVLRRLNLERVTFVKNILGILDYLASQSLKDVFGRLGASIGLSCGYLICTLVWAYCSIRSFSMPIDFSMVSFVGTTLQLLSIIPVQVFGGIGVTEATSLYFYGMFGIDQSKMAVVLLGVRTAFILMNAVSLMFYFGFVLSSRTNSPVE